MTKNSILKNYEIKIVNSKKDYKVKDLKEEIKNWELKAKEEGKSGLILLARNQLTLGITLPFVDIVFLMNDIISSDKIIQMMYRCMTKSINTNNQYKLNLNQGDTLELNVVSVWGVNTFDVILGNPPYNKGGIRSHTGKQLGEKNETIWTKFIEKSFGEWLRPDGFLVFINPLSWLKKSHSLHNEMLEKHIVWLKLWDNSQSKALINADIPISLYILQNTLNATKKETNITSILKRRSLTTTSTEYLNPKYSIPLAFHSIFNKLIQFIEKYNCNLEYKTKTIKSSRTKAKIPTEYTIEDMWAVDTYIIKEGLKVKKAIEQHPDANKRKLIISDKASFTGAFIHIFQIFASWTLMILQKMSFMN
jgi:hypothetical protein